ncbi:hypothetical protein [Rubrivivax gelatinosus]|uniref:hypothetical protein n=1 Tax=Rubrivivax gelatinosus TaxID=28068 RepID=UPI0012FE1532|nr:hypothetical protein [Rubrivivax gelatinosus]MBG6079144.1 hypothetical protein [Rubrivivax gelatinosus]
MLDLHAPIEPASSAAGFRIGQRFSDLNAAFVGAHVVEYYEGFNLNRALNENTGVLVVSRFGVGAGCSVYFGPQTVRLVFSDNKVLGCIYLFDGYLGVYRGTPIGAPLSSISAVEPISFDEGDEMYYRVDPSGEYLQGLSIVAAKANFVEHERTLIHGYCVHDWSIFRSRA